MRTRSNFTVHTDAQPQTVPGFPAPLVAWILALLSLSCFCAAGIPVAGVDEVPFDLVNGHLIVVEGSLPGLDRSVNLVVDTGATATLVSRKLLIEAVLRKLPPMGITSTAFGSPVKVERVFLEKLQIGRRTITRSCLAADIPWDGIDIILGLDVLRQTSLTIDYENSKLLFGAASFKQPSAGLEEEEGLFVVPVTMNGQTMRLAVDTGAHLTVIYQASWTAGNQRGWDEKMVKIAHTGGTVVARQHTRFDLQIGQTRVGRTSLAVLAAGSGDSSVDGFLGTACLGLKRVHLDFELQALSIES
ncbi:MAG: retroviral-like aspartic protease family protein [Acidobacteriota bacterium]